MCEPPLERMDNRSDMLLKTMVVVISYLLPLGVILPIMKYLCCGVFYYVKNPKLIDNCFLSQ